MTVIHRNFYRLLRSGAFDSQEQIEPMSAYKWGVLRQKAIQHDVVVHVYEGLLHCSNQFLLRLTDKQWEQWEKLAAEARQRAAKEDDDSDEFLRADHLTNPLLNSRLQKILDDEQSDLHTRRLLLMLIRCSRHLLNRGLPVKLLVDLGQYIRTEGHRLDYITLEHWLKSLRYQQMAQLEGRLLTTLLGIDRSEIPFAGGKEEKNAELVAQELIELSTTCGTDFYFSQDADNIFVHSSGGSAMLGRIRRTARYFRYIPSETLTNFVATFAHSLSHIEE